MKIAVIIPVTRPEQAAICVDALSKQSFLNSEIEIILIKDKDQVIELKKTDIKIIIIEEENPHPAFRRNLGVKLTNARILAFLDDDTIPCSEWLSEAVRYIEKESVDGVCGPELQSQNNLSLGYTLAGAANETFFVEGVERMNVTSEGPVRFYNIRLCNVIMRRKVWEAVGGFNEIANYHIDDIEFFYLACNKKYRFHYIPKMLVHHRPEPFPFRYLKKKFNERFYTGMNAMMFREIYSLIPQIWFVYLLYPIIILIFLLFFSNSMYIMPFLAIYFGLILWFSYPWFRKNKKIFILLPIVFISTHIVELIGFLAGTFYFFVNRNYGDVTVRIKQGRLEKCSESLTL
ncbi:MAG: glycosyltransferase [Candidatus Omnitrophica bacterium]|nr:glycosyltransferase [Candidatus Omnitrophota bacterium]